MSARGTGIRAAVAQWWDGVTEGRRAKQLIASRGADEGPPDDDPVALGEPRFRVQRVNGGTTYQAYAGDDGVKALEAWERYRRAPVPGVFWFYDTHHETGRRGMFTRVND